MCYRQLRGKANKSSVMPGLVGVHWVKDIIKIDIDIFEIGGSYYISEVNPRFGGGYPHAYECGCDHMKLIVNNLEGKSNPVNIGNYAEGIHMMKYNEVMIR